MSNILINHQKKKKNKHQTSTHTSKRLYFYFKYLRKLQSPKLFYNQKSHFTISKAVLYISGNYNQQSLSLHQLFSTSQKITIGQPQSRQKPQEIEKEGEGEGERKKGRRRRKRKGRRGRKRKGMRRRNEGRKGITEEAGLKNIPFEEYRPL